MAVALTKYLPEFDNPPVIEVVCGALFKPLSGLLAPHLGMLWERFKSEYPKCQEVPPLAPVVEHFGEEPVPQIELTDVPPLPRVWFIHADEIGIIQIQRDRFLHNWKKARPRDAYPRYTTVIKLFQDKLSVFESFLADTSVGSIEPRQYELTYVNHIPKDGGLPSLADVAKGFPDFAWRVSADRFLPMPEAINWRTTFALPDQAGRLHVALRSGVRREDGTPILLLELTVRGFPKGTTRDAAWPWFNTAHEWIVRAFTDLTSDNLHQLWKRTR